MRNGPDAPLAGARLICFGGASLLHPASERHPLRAKDLALLYYLFLEPGRLHSKPYLAALLWSESEERKARHSLNQALARIRALLGNGSVVVSGDQVQWQGEIEADAREFLAAVSGDDPPDPLLEVYRGDFLAHFDPGPGAGEFMLWADGKRAEFRNRALEYLDARGQAAEEAGEWEEALAYGRRAAAIDPGWEAAHRRIMRALAARGDRHRALLHYEGLAALRSADGDEPEYETQSLAAALQQPREPAPPAIPPSAPRRPRAAAPVLSLERGESASGGSSAAARDAPHGLRVPSVPPAVGSGRARRRIPTPWIAGLSAAAVVAAVLLARGADPDRGPVAAGPAGVAQAAFPGRACRAGEAAAQLVEEVAHYGIQLKAGTPFLKAWTLQNVGPCSWGPDFRLHFVAAPQTRMSATMMDIPLTRPVPPGDTVTFRVQMRAPMEPGTHDEVWQLRDGADRTVRVGRDQQVVARVVVPQPRTRECGPGESTATVLIKKFMDGVVRVPAERFRFGWTLKNNGPCTWSARSTFRFVSASSARVTQLDSLWPSRSVAPGESYTFLVPVRAPAAAGTFQEQWTFRDAHGHVIPADHVETVGIQFRVPERGTPIAQLPICKPGEAKVRFVDENWLDSTRVLPGQEIVKRWTVFNVGDCAWGADFRLQFASSRGPRLSSGGRQLPLGEVVPPWTTYTFEIPMRMPRQEGTVREDWRFVDGEGNHVFVSMAPYLIAILKVSADDAPGPALTRSRRNRE